MVEAASGGIFVGLISGTSMDGIDAVAVDFSSNTPTILASLTRPFDEGLRAELDELRRDPDDCPVSRLGRLDACLGDCFAAAALAVLESAGLQPSHVEAIGSHGQTVVHHPEADPPFTLQIADPHRIAAQTGIATVADFRRADLAAGGQGAPLAPLLHDAVFRSDQHARAVVNLGGIANVTLLIPDRSVIGFDTGPANCFLDLWYRRHHDGGRFDSGGDWAASGRVDEPWLEMLLSDPYFDLPAPKSTGIEYFSPGWLDQCLPAWAQDRPADVQATLAEFSAQSIAEALQTLGGGDIGEVIVCGGGWGNDDLIARLRARLNDGTIDHSDAFGLPADHVESTLFAWLARERLAQRPVSSQSVTGAARPVLLGVIHRC